MSQIFEGCQGKPQVKIYEKKCPQCGAEIEIFSVETEAKCPECGFTIYNDTLTCVQWCKYARKCVGDEMYEQKQRSEGLQYAARMAQILIRKNGI